MNRKIAFTFLVLAFGAVGLSAQKAEAKTLQSGELKVSFEGESFLEKQNLAPGDSFSEKLTVENSGDSPFDFSIWADSLSDSNEDAEKFLKIFKIEVKEDGETLWKEEKTFWDLFNLPEGSEIILTQIPAGSSTTYDFKISFPKEADNSYQGLGAKFNFHVGTIAIPSVLGIEEEKEEGKVLGMAIGPLATGADLIYPILGSLAALSTGLYIRRRTACDTSL